MNRIAGKLYENCGFTATGNVVGDEIKLAMILDSVHF